MKKCKSQHASRKMSSWHLSALKNPRIFSVTKESKHTWLICCRIFCTRRPTIGTIPLAFVYDISKQVFFHECTRHLQCRLGQIFVVVWWCVCVIPRFLSAALFTKAPLFLLFDDQLEHSNEASIVHRRGRYLPRRNGRR